MNARKTVALFALTTLLTAGTALAAPVGTAKSVGDFRPFWQSQFGSTARAQYAYTPHNYATRAPMAIAPATVAATATPTAGRRFSYEPSTATAGATGTAAAATAAPATTMAPITQGHAYHHAHRAARHASVDRWSLPKTDSRKYTTN